MLDLLYVLIWTLKVDVSAQYPHNSLADFRLRFGLFIFSLSNTL